LEIQLALLSDSKYPFSLRILDWHNSCKFTAGRLNFALGIALETIKADTNFKSQC